MTNPITDLTGLILYSHRLRCLVVGCYYGVRGEDACIYCGELNPSRSEPLGVSPIKTLQDKQPPPEPPPSSDDFGTEIRGGGGWKGQ